jgi:nucleotide-binding universal stress UspA family protein
MALSRRTEKPGAQTWERTMAYKDILVCLDPSEAGKRRAAFAVEFARVHQAHITGFTLTPTGAILYFAPETPPILLPPDFLENARAASQSAHAHFEEEARRAGVSYEQRPLEGLPPVLPELFTTSTRHADLSILPQPPDGSLALAQEMLVERALYASGRPTLVVPASDSSLAQPDVVLAAWDGSQEATRAFNDAIPILQKAKRVVVMVAKPDRMAHSYGEEPGADIALHLTRHGIQTEVRRAAEDGVSAGALILTQAKEVGAGLIVMGAYHHSRLREFILGGPTRTVLEHTTVPVFMAH